MEPEDPDIDEELIDIGKKEQKKGGWMSFLQGLTGNKVERMKIFSLTIEGS
jgi:hypothetical protein